MCICIHIFDKIKLNNQNDNLLRFIDVGPIRLSLANVIDENDSSDLQREHRTCSGSYELFQEFQTE